MCTCVSMVCDSARPLTVSKQPSLSPSCVSPASFASPVVPAHYLTLPHTTEKPPPSHPHDRSRLRTSRHPTLQRLRERGECTLWQQGVCVAHTQDTHDPQSEFTLPASRVHILSEREPPPAAELCPYQWRTCSHRLTHTSGALEARSFHHRQQQQQQHERKFEHWSCSCERGERAHAHQ
jgi:hypothetical protein